jgi:glutathione synthase/RimK-type ligase-like ATP-grasp enzyme
VSRVAIATCAGEDVDPDSRPLLDALAAQDVVGELARWDDPQVDWDRFDLVVIRSTWDYAPRRTQYLSWAKSVRRLANPYAAVAFSSDKHYLGELAARGHRVVPTFFCDVGVAPQFPDADFVVKPSVGAGSLDADRYGAHEVERATRHVAALHERGRDVLIQPYVSSVDEQGERALIFIDGAFSHAMTKAAMLNVVALDRHALYRRKQMSLAEAEPDAVALAGAVLDDFGFGGLLYARVDLVRVSGGWALMELELVEPSLFLTYHRDAAAAIAAAIARRLT